ncbi:MAG: SMC-Scp complex subunit ScpB [Arthrobacter sp.]|uniref:SMC-Scp complex subunit ScpB n=1 Tax=unclassified Arthrobacter TaxID=235627 RepID=UPI0026555808|nr:SMC-Scp complex subunit ScpB [Micrococcaceae bacterium]MDN5823234.1 SMC-Scp complex subunit ScpB [Micrococcaceae bacterium]MDN5878314.1 SMC-Scp complex subunit ScpB [Micrococcaceae bacterium]MDN5886430.1 SMC-Scp complex subunit ScpB [Micrococcaceae bacterium]MDN6178595.1 SMC-Scp complex subunit ScpB [Micrococcaceae bacterium]
MTGNDAGAPPPPEDPHVDDLPGGARAAIEAVLMVADEPVAPQRLAEVLAVDVQRVRELLAELQNDYDLHHGFELRELAGGWRVYSKRDFAPVVSRFVLDGATSRLSQAALETLAVIAYRQPVSRARIAAIRGVNVDSVVRTLSMRGLVAEEGTDPTSGAMLYRTTGYFLERLGVDSVADLPQLSPHLPGLDDLEHYDEDPF